MMRCRNLLSVCSVLSYFSAVAMEILTLLICISKRLGYLMFQHTWLGGNHVVITYLVHFITKNVRDYSFLRIRLYLLSD